ncbi:DUF1775 domain-containing protein [Puniceibacterium sediminis]|uniref:YncI copper-binding domain-containing protein n=1 Tax=Puniceibacterium sediminis TaxID=1608407 RepID=A0A238Z5Y3_9RHOB|nr:DUF1775 domain-containing protein [Puniceibacterium sediminis]SNR78419.1 hypothetical protein SAMN06265370_12430 [Puniceibacterium sediminis]
MNYLNTTLTVLLGLGCLAGAVQAHATLEQSEAAVGATTKITLRVPHGCKGEATNEVRIDIPEGFYAVKPMPKAGWALTTETGPYAVPYDNHGTEMTEGVRAVTWSGGALEDGWYDEFTLRGTVGPDAEAGSMLYFPSLQSCANGTADWTDTSGSRDVSNPAPDILLVAGMEDQGHGAMAMPLNSTVTLGDLELSGPFARATLPNQPVAGGFLTITNTGDSDDTLIAARSDAAARMEVHEMAMDGDVMRMRELEQGLPIPAGETVMLKPGGFHIMFMDLAGPLAEGDSTRVTLVFEKAGEVTLTMPVVARNRAGHGGRAGHGADGK